MPVADPAVLCPEEYPGLVSRRAGRAAQAGTRGCLVAGQQSGGRSPYLSRGVRRARRREAAREELRMAREIQQGLFPAPPRLAGFDVGGASYPAAATGGDYFDFIPLPDGSLGIAVGDVSGHGFGPALLMSATHAYLRALARTHADVSAILTQLNRLLAEDTGGEHFVTLLLARLDPRARTLTYASAGHPTGYVVGPGGAVRRRLESTGIPLGVLADADFPAGDAVTLEPGDAALFLTDGLLEARSPDGGDFTAQAVLDLLRVYRGCPSRQIVDNLYHAARAFAQNRPQDDDITAVVIKA
jgi:sigma-B regulation protein RsbU (phosphoserine phosphatase)